MQALLNPSISRTIISEAQESRKLYFLLRVCYVFILCYVNIRLIFSRTLERRIHAGQHDFERVDPDDFIALRKLAMKRRKPTLGRIIDDTLRSVLDRLYRKLVRTRIQQIFMIEMQELGVTAEEDKLAKLEQEEAKERESRKSSRRSSKMSSRRSSKSGSLPLLIDK